MSKATNYISPLKRRAFRIRATLVGLAAFALLAVATSSGRMAAAPTAVFTTDSTCSGVNLNSYPNKDAVYLNGGPSSGLSGLADGNYWVRVTEPDGTPLGSSIGSGNDTPFSVVGGVIQQCYQLSAILIKESDDTPGYDDTTNGGDEYKVAVCDNAEFTESGCKSDNFKVKNAGDNPLGGITVLKFYDSDGDGVKDAGEVYLEGWAFELVGQTAAQSVFANPLLTSFTSNANPGVYTATERDPIQTNWVASTDKTLSTVVVEGSVSTIEFGNYCTLTPGGRTIGFWSNKNGQSLLTAGNFTTLNGLNLRRANGDNRDFESTLTNNKKDFNNWLLSANATNMAYMLSAQLAATQLNVIHGFTNPAVIVDGTDTDVNELIAYANSLLVDGSTLAGDPNRAEQERVKNILDLINNGAAFTQPSAANCPYSFTGVAAPSISSVSSALSVETTSKVSGKRW